MNCITRTRTRTAPEHGVVGLISLSRPFPTLPVCSRTFLAHPSSATHGESSLEPGWNILEPRTGTDLSPSASAEFIISRHLTSSRFFSSSPSEVWRHCSSLLSFISHLQVVFVFLRGFGLTVNPSHHHISVIMTLLLGHVFFLISCEHYPTFTASGMFGIDCVWTTFTGYKVTSNGYVIATCRLILRDDDL